MEVKAHQNALRAPPILHALRADPPYGVAEGLDRRHLAESVQNIREAPKSVQRKTPLSVKVSSFLLNAPRRVLFDVNTPRGRDVLLYAGEVTFHNPAVCNTTEEIQPLRTVIRLQGTYCSPGRSYTVLPFRNRRNQSICRILLQRGEL